MLAVLPAGFREDLVADGLSYPTAMAIAPDGRIFVAQKGGGVRVIKDGHRLPELFAFVDAETSYEYGLCGIALDPDFSTNGYVYVNYIAKGLPSRNLIERFTASGDVAVKESRTTIFELDNVNPPGPTGNYHIGGAMQFGVDGHLYVSTGENTVPANAQSLGNLHGKILRIGKDGSIPADNPFFATASGNNRAIWAYGMRNPFTFAIQPGTGRMLINDVGQNSFEEINVGRPGANYGWPLSEGPTTDPRFDSPLYAYTHLSTELGAACIAGSTFYDPAVVALPASYVGRYFFADFNNAWMATLDPVTGTSTMFATQLSSMPLDIDVGPDGSLYYLAWGNGMSVSRISYTGDLSPAISAPPQDVMASNGLKATFTVAATGDGQLSYRWQRAAAGSGEFADIPGATTARYRVPAVASADSGSRYRVVVSNLHGSVTSQPATLTVVANQLPTVTILSPASDRLFTGGETLVFAASATDPETGGLSADAVRWQVDMLHGAISRPLVPPTVGTSGSFVIPDETPYTRTDVTIRLTVTARDPVTGLFGTSMIDLHPRTSTVTLQSDPVGLTLGLGGEPQAAAFARTSIVGIRQSISAAAFQATSAGFYRFIGWDHGGPATQVVAVPASDVTYTARYVGSPVFVDTFDAGQGSRFQPWSGSWTLDGSGGYVGRRGQQAGGAISVFAGMSTLPTSYEIGASVGLDTAAGNGFVIFDVVAPDDFKYVGLRGSAGTLVAGRRTPAGWQDEVSVWHGVDVRVAQQLSIRISGTNVTARLGERQFLAHDFGESLGDGGVGLATGRGIARFGRFFQNVAFEQREVFATVTSVRENSLPGTLVGILGTRGWSYGATFSYQLVPGEGGADNALFAIEGDRLKTAGRLNFEVRSSYSIRIRSTEATGVVSEQPLTITLVDDANEPLVVEDVIGPDGGVYGPGTVLPFTLVLSRPASVAGKPELPIQVGGVARSAAYTGGSGTLRLTFSYEVRSTDRSGDIALRNAVTLPKKSVGVTAGGIRLIPALPHPGAVLPGVRIDTAAPVAVGMLEAPAAGTYRTGSTIRFRVAYSEPVRVAGLPTIRLSLGGGRSRTVEAVYESGSDTAVLTFAYEVKAADAMRAASWLVISNAVTLPAGSSILDAASNRAQLTVQVPTNRRIRFEN
ncbi:MAG: PQQ-dependent sugar dehydrogenase [Planctomycetes bacterium]|nr:PQQ-dependent sugar dehydrogenase [Planctomycetota bacterium]